MSKEAVLTTPFTQLDTNPPTTNPYNEFNITTNKEVNPTTPLTQLDINSRAAHIRDKLGIPQDRVDLLRQRYPLLFSEDEIIARQTELAQNFGITNHQSLIKVFPEILGLSTDEINSKFDRLSQIGFKSPQTAVNSYPKLIITENKEIQDFINQVKNIDPNLNVIKMLNNLPAILTTVPPENIRKRINFLKDQQFSNPHHIVESCPQVCRLTEGFIITIIQKFREAGFSQKLFQTSPGWFDNGVIRFDTLKKEFSYLPPGTLIRIISQNPNLGQIKNVKDIIEKINNILTNKPNLPNKPIITSPTTPELPQTRQDKPLLPKTSTADKPTSVVPASTIPETSQARPIESPPKIETVKQLSTVEKTSFIRELNQQYSLNLAPATQLINSRVEKISLIAQVLHFYQPIDPIICYKKTNFFAYTTIEDLLIAFINKKPHHTINDLYNEIKTFKNSSLSKSDKYQLITDFFNQHPDDYAHLQTLYQKIKSGRSLLPHKNKTHPPDKPTNIENTNNCLLTKAPKGYLSLTGIAKKFRISPTTLKPVINEYPNEIGLTRIYKFGKSYVEGYSQKQIKIIKKTSKIRRFTTSTSSKRIFIKKGFDYRM